MEKLFELRSTEYQVTGVDLTDVGRQTVMLVTFVKTAFAIWYLKILMHVHLAALSRDPDCRGKAFDCFTAM